MVNGPPLKSIRHDLDRIVPLCDLCRRVYDASPAWSPGAQWTSSDWTDLRTFFKGRVIQHAQILFARTYCDECRQSCDLAAQYREFR